MPNSGIDCLGSFRFEDIEDSPSHEVADRLLAAVATRMVIALRDADTIDRMDANYSVIDAAAYRERGCRMPSGRPWLLPELSGQAHEWRRSRRHQ